MLARWFDRAGIGQMVAPDENVAKEPIPDESRAMFWQIVAPDPNFSPPPPAPPRDAFLPVPDSAGQILCMHCKKWTNVGTPPSERRPFPASTPIMSTPGRNFNDNNNRITTPSARNLFTPPPSARRASSMAMAEVESLVLSAAKDTAAGMASPPHIRENRDKVFRFCGATTRLNEKLQKRLRNMLKKDPTLIHSRATNLGMIAPDGYTPLMAAVHANNEPAVNIILELSPNGAHLDRDLQGQTVLHIAAEKGHVDLVNLLRPKFHPQGMASPPPVDLIGRTPLGRAVCSPNPTARKRQKDLESALFSPGDLSVFGEPKPEMERTAKEDTLKITYGISDMPGMRVTMEDATCTCTFEKHGKTYFLAGVFDGHGDSGYVSKFLAENVSSILQSNMEEEEGEMDWNGIWTKTCLQLDGKLKEENLPGGSTAVLALISKDLIVVANVGDSRAVLIQSSKNSGGTGDLEKKMAELAVSTSPVKDPTSSSPDDGVYTTADDMKPQNTESDDPTPKSSGPIAIAMSEDHKPDLEGEKTRIEKAGLKVVPVKFTEDGKEVTIHKVFRGESEQLATSRAFGDFDYKTNSSIAPEEQAVIAVADVRVHKREHEADKFLVLACDGVWDVMENDQVMTFVLHQAEVRAEMTDTVLPEVGDALLRESLNRGSRDNMTTVIIALSGESEKIQPVIKGKTLDFSG